MTNLVTPQKRVSSYDFVVIEDGAGQIGGASGTRVMTWDDFRNGTVLGGYRYLIRNHLPATTGASGVKRHFCYGVTSGSWRFNAPWNPSHLVTATPSGAFALNPELVADSDDISLSRADTDARVKFVQQYRKIHRQFQGGVFLGELRETLKMIKSPLRAFRQGLDAYSNSAKKLNRRHRGKALGDALAGTWLEYVFGWKPLLQDVDDAMKALAFSDYQEIITINSSGSSETSVISEYGAGTSIYAWKAIMDTKSSASVRIKGQVMGSVGSPPVSKHLSSAGLTLSDFVPTVWELIPYSFLVDYFTNAGDIIDTACAGSVSVLWGNKSQRVQRVQTCQQVIVDNAFTEAIVGANNYKGGSLSHSGYTNSHVRFGRGSFNSVSVSLSDFHFELPEIGSRKWLNIAALAKIRF